ncbi:class A beta-lactamase [Methylobacterium gnaphalii]|uniref:Beta-lactamase n=1 Tax=Methylobacterium gnaphalii TaxID=1010610 RepID=A0A512JEH2_9HYPH|nr:class A beta-lactamase [Methylobacterium gnaphalii]GEP08345.1 beta-lactamase [Methylobacterium gnaphalii]GJD67879.1 Beta-lactamase [Methylobacterium gnaphalii]GLS51024.1 beta-lactamase [Methylobacterium gnaphalii]
MINRRAFTTAAALLALPDSFRGGATAAEPTPEEVFAQIERSVGGRLGVAALEAGTGRGLRYRAGERFPLCSTFKLLAAAAVLSRVDAGQESLERRIAYTASDLVDYSPTTAARVTEGAIPLADLCEAAITLSDNTAGNLMLSRIGGPSGLTRYLRERGDTVTRLDRTEPALNEALPGDPRDTTSPDAMVANLDRFVLGDALATSSRARLQEWLLANRTGATRFRAGLPPDWRVGDKTGTGERGTANDVGLLYPPDGAPILAAVYLTESTGSPEQRNASIAQVARTIANNLKAQAHSSR